MKRIEHREQQWAFPFVEYSPTNGGKKLPLVIQLHGAGERGNGLEELVYVDRLGFSKFIADKEIDCLFVMPQCTQDTFWVAHIESVLKFIDQIKAAYDVDEDRIYLTGISMGGYGTWYTAMARPSQFAAIAPVCGGGMAWNAPILKMPVWVFHGDCDGTVSTVQSDEMVESLRKAGTDVTYTRLPGVGHNAWDYTYDQVLLDWLLSKKK
ncbi:MAG: prolyl oligopeptidase family serine peptidase [Clostridia bacterium]|nr:prolyl oligopeptidase family serine peptidase [Clostridia bacterium]